VLKQRSGSSKQLKPLRQNPVKTLFLISGLALLSSPAFAVFQNGSFETNSFQNWTIEGGANPGLVGAEPFSGASISIVGTTPGPVAVLGAGLDQRAPNIRLPRLGSFTAKINDELGGASVSILRQIDTLRPSDIDPRDNLAHVRFSFAPVLEDPAHRPEEQPYIYVRVRNVTDNQLLFEQFTYSGQPGVQFLSGNGDWKYLQFTDVDATLPASAINKQIEIYLVVADCSLGGHGGYVYVDGFGSSPIPSLGSNLTALNSLTWVGCGWLTLAILMVAALRNQR
jgi:hypothetical protein